MEPNLSPRELTVLDLVRQGLTNKEIGNRLYISERTAKFHMSNLLHKFQVETRRHLIIRMFRCPHCFRENSQEATQ